VPQTINTNVNNNNSKKEVTKEQQQRSVAPAKPIVPPPSPPKPSIEEDEPEVVSKVYEEDDLMSVASESIDSLYGDYSFVNDHHHQPPTSPNNSRPTPNTNNNVATVRPQQQHQPHQFSNNNNNTFNPSQLRRNTTQKATASINLELAKNLNEEERELMRFYQPQVDSNTTELCRLVDEFFTIVEEHQAAKSFVQKIQMICIKTQTLVCIARMVTKDDITTVSKAFSTYLAQEANHLDSLLNECVSSARIAKDKSQSVPAIQAMISSVASVSQAALNLKLFWKSCV